MQFHIGQRVRFKGSSKLMTAPSIGGQNVLPIGALGVIVTGAAYWPSGYWYVDFDGIRSSHPTGTFACIPDCIEPLEGDVSFEKFMERVMKPVDLGQPIQA